jgi:hypothetical protein
MTDINERTYAHDFLRQEMDNFMSRASVTVLSGAGKLKAGTVLGKITNGGATAAAKGGGNAGTGAASAVSAQTKAIVGVYKAIVEIAAANAATWNLYDPNGKLIDQKQYSGGGATAVFANDHIHATITDGGTDFVVGDEFDITVAAGSGKYIQPTATAIDGSGVGTVILMEEIDATSADVAARVIALDAQVANDRLFYDASISDPTKLGVVNAGLLAANIQFVGTA